MKRIKTLEELNEQLGNPYFDMSRYWAKTDMELLAWLLVAHVAFDPDILIKGTREIDVPDPVPDDYNVQMMKLHRDKYTSENKALREWLTTTPYENIAGYMAYLVRRIETDKISNYYDAAQDFYADSWHKYTDFEHGEISGREFVNIIYSQIDEVKSHVSKGKSMGLSMDEIVLHDAMWGLLPRNYDPDLVTIARDALKEAMNQLPPRPYIWSEKGDEVYAPQMLEYTAKKLEDAGYDIGYKQHYTIEQGYLIEFFSRLYWREAASKPED